MNNPGRINTAKCLNFLKIGFFLEGLKKPRP